jgi:DNA-binding GntR family transcriptional regulator
VLGSAHAPNPNLSRRAQDVASLTDLAYDELLDAILDQRLPPGARLVPETLASQLGVSATPVKLALARLVAEGLVGEILRRGMFVTELGPEELGALFDARLLLEASAVRDFTQRATPAYAERLAALADAHRHAIDTSVAHASRAISDTDRDFHRAIVELTGNEHVVRWYERTNIHIQANRSADPRRRPATLREHAAIVESIRAGDAFLAEQAVRLHVTNAKEFAMQALIESANQPRLRRIRARRHTTA